MKFLILLILMFSILPGSLIKDWGNFEKNVRDGKISKTDAKKKFHELYISLKSDTKKFILGNEEKWVFPVENYSLKDVGKGGFRPEIYYGGSKIKGYDFYDGNNHGGHPAYDIFIYDKNQDCLDDRTNKPVNILAPTDLVVLSVNTNWVNGSEIRGGNYIWAFNPEKDIIYYFSHLGIVKINPGEYIKKGTILATVGRTGKNAFAKRSPTHLHFMVLKVSKNYNLIPFDYLEKFF